MILVDVFVPSVDTVYDFQLDENAAIGMLVEEMGEMVGQKEHGQIGGNVEKLCLCSLGSRRILPKNRTLAECEIVTGDKLMLL